MTALKLSAAIVFAFALAGIAVGAPTPRDTFGGTAASKADPRLDRAAPFRTAQVGECAAIAPRQAPTADRSARERFATRAPHHERKAMASVGCTVVWSD